MVRLRPPPTPLIVGVLIPVGVTVGTFEVVIVSVEVEPVTGLGLNEYVVPSGIGLVTLRVTGGTNSLRLMAIAKLVLAPRVTDWPVGAATKPKFGL